MEQGSEALYTRQQKWLLVLDQPKLFTAMYMQECHEIVIISGFCTISTFDVVL